MLQGLGPAPTQKQEEAWELLALGPGTVLCLCPSASRDTRDAARSLLLPCIPHHNGLLSAILLGGGARAAVPGSQSSRQTEGRTRALLGTMTESFPCSHLLARLEGEPPWALTSASCRDQAGGC